MKIGVIKEQASNERRVALTPETAKRLISLVGGGENAPDGTPPASPDAPSNHGRGCSIYMETGAGALSSYPDELYEAVGVTIEKKALSVLEQVDALFVVQLPDSPKATESLLKLRSNATLIGLLNPHTNQPLIDALGKKNILSFALENMPRITRAQSMDVLSSQSNLGGYRAVIEAMTLLNRAMPMMMTAAGSLKPAKVVVLGAGVAGLQAIATAKRMGTKVYAFDVRPAVKEQVQSLGATFIEIEGESPGELAETQGGYAKEMDEDFKRRQQAKIAETLKDADIVITTALIPGKPAPELIPAPVVRTMKSGAVIIDMAVAAGGNCPLSRPGIITTDEGVIIAGCPNLPSMVAHDASALYARNVYNFFELLWNKEEKKIAPDWGDPLVKDTCLTPPSSTKSSPQ